jgi:hypothetical protein
MAYSTLPVGAIPTRTPPLRGRGLLHERARVAAAKVVEVGVEYAPRSVSIGLRGVLRLQHEGVRDDHHAAIVWLGKGPMPYALHDAGAGA